MPDPGVRDVDIAICGAGPVGAACALFLLERGVAASRIALIDARTREAAAADDRMIAVSQGSATLLDRLGAWRDGAERRATPIETIHVSQRGRFGQTLIDRRDFDTPALGYVIRHGDLTAALDATLARHGLATRRPLRVVDVATAGEDLRVSLAAATPAATPAASPAATPAADLSDLTARHVVHAEGGSFDGQRRRAIHRDYGQAAVTAFVTVVARPSPALARTAFERFTEDGPIALLPATGSLADGAASDGWSLVWCGRPEAASERLALDDDAFLRALHRAFGDRLGRFAAVGPRRRYPLGLNAVAAPARVRSPSAAEFAIGNAAQALHPVAGQGLNLGFRDAHDVAAVLATTGTRPSDAATDQTTDAATLVARYAAARRIDRAATVDLTDLMPRVFASRLAPVVLARGAALALLDVVPPLRDLLARQMMDGQR